MPCYRPLQGYRSRQVNASGKRSVVFNRKDGFEDLQVQVPCGQCIGCKLDRARMWAIRCVDESKMHIDNSFVTLTYDDDNLPSDKSLIKDDLQKFIKRLRERIDNEYPGRKIRYYACGEYGETTDRPHYHIIVFGFTPDDKQFIGQSQGHKLYSSDSLANVWGKGHVSIGDVTFDSACYVARYCTKKITGDKADEHYNGRQPEFSLMSTGRVSGGGIGGQYFAKFIGDYERAGFRWSVDDSTIVRATRYYENIYEKFIGDYNGYKGGAKKLGRRLASDNTPDRLHVKEKIQMYKIKQCKDNKGESL